MLRWKTRSDQEVKDSLEKVLKIIEDDKFEDKMALRSSLDALGVELGDRGLAYWPLRAVLTGEKTSPDPIDVAWILGKEKTLERVDFALKS